MQEARVAHALARSARTLTAPKMTTTRSTAVPLPARPSFVARRVTQPEATRRQMLRPLQPPASVLPTPRRLPTPRNDDHDDAMLEHGLFVELMNKVLGVGHNRTRIVDLFSGVQRNVNNANAIRFYSLIDNAFHHKWIDIDGWANCPYKDPAVIITTLSKGPFTKTPEGHQYALVLEDDATGYKAVGTMCLKSDAHEVFGELLEAFKNAKAKVRQP
jgi:hypothetical protein